MGGFMGIGGDTSQSRKMWETGADKEMSVFNTAMPWAKETKTQADSSVTSGMNTLNEVKDYFRKIFGGSRSEQLGAAAPEINAINAQADAQRRAEANLGMGRTGGTAAINANADTQRLATADNMMFGARSGAAQAEAQIANEQANIGLQQLSAALRALGMSDEAIKHYMDSAQNQQEFDYKRAKEISNFGLDTLSKLFTSIGLGDAASIAKPTVAS